MKCSECASVFEPYRTVKTCSPGCKAARTKRLKQEKYLANAGAVKAKAKTYREENPEKIKATRRVYRARVGERLRENSKAYYRENADRLKAYQKEYRQANPEILRIANRRNRAAKRSAPSEPYTAETITALYGSDCHLCSGAIDLDAPRTPGVVGWEWSLHLDHVIPLSQGGTDLIENVRPSHALCNLRKARSIAGTS